MDLTDGKTGEEAFKRFFRPFERFFKRAESRANAPQYRRGLLAEVQRKNGWQRAEVVGEAHPDGMQRLLYGADWDEEGVCQALRAQSIGQLGQQPGIAVIDESGFVKKGECSAGVARPYWGRVGQVENGQVGVYLGYVAPQGQALLDRELYLAKAWCNDPVRPERAKIPESVCLATQPQWAVRLLERAWAEGLPVQWVGGDLRPQSRPTHGNGQGWTLLCHGNSKNGTSPH